MNFDLSDDAKALGEQAARLLAEQSALLASRTAAAEGDGFDRSLWRQLSNLGWPAVAVPEDRGGIGMGYEALCVLAEQIGSSLAAVPLIASFAACEALLLAGDDAQQDRWLPALAAGTSVGALAIGEGACDPGRFAVRADGCRLTGSKLPVADGMMADILIVAAESADGPGLYAVEIDAPGIRREALQTYDLGSRHAKVIFENAPATRLARSGGDTIDRLLARLAVVSAFEQLGGARACLEMATSHVHQRIAFGRPIGSFQAVKHKLADIYVAIELGRSNALYGAWTLDRQQDEQIAGAAAHLSATTAFSFAAREALHLHGGQGFSWEQDCHLYFRRSRMLASALGSTSWWRNRLIDGIEQQERESPNNGF